MGGVMAVAKVQAEQQKEIPIRRRKTLVGIVVSDKMQKTVVVEVSRRVLNRKFKKYTTQKATYQAHAENNEAKVGDEVVIVETRPLSRHKRWRVHQVVTQAKPGLGANV